MKKAIAGAALIVGGTVAALLLLFVLIVHLTAEPNSKCRAANLSVGLTQQNLLQICGKPLRVNRDSSHSADQWVYGGAERLYVYTDEKDRVRDWRWTEQGTEVGNGR